MRKRRVIALLLALSLTVSMNGLTVLAEGTAGVQVTDVSVLSEDDSANASVETGDEAGESQENEASDGEDQSRDTAGEETGSGTNAEQEGIGDGAETVNPTEEDSAENGEDAETPDEESASEDETAEPFDEETEAETAAVQADMDVRMVTFTDDTGMCITYDANETAEYQYVVSEEGVLTDIQNQSGQSLQGSLEGNIVLTQPTEGGTPYTSVAASLFQGNTKITYVKLPSGVTSVAANTFKDCTSLKGIYLPAGITAIGASAFQGCTALTQLAIPKSTQTIGAGAFKGDTKLFMVHMKDAEHAKLVSIGDSAFEGCTALENFCSDQEFILPDSLTSIGDRAFYGCSTISNITLPDSVATIGSSAFKDCAGLTGVYLSTTLTAVAASAFEGCNKLNSVEIGESQTPMTIAENAFKDCYSLGSITLPGRVTAVADGAFSGCTQLARVYIINTMTTLADGAFPTTHAGKLYLVGTSAICSAYQYVSDHFDDDNLQFIDINNTNANTEVKYQYNYDTTGVDKDDIELIVSTDASAKTDINDKSVGGVVRGTKLYVFFDQTSMNKAGVTLVKGSLKCNGTVVSADQDGNYTFNMPDGGAFLTAEFTATGSGDKIKGLTDDVSAELSNGDTLKVGQQTRLFLVSTKDEGSYIPASKVTYEVNDSDKGKVSVAADGTITVLSITDGESSDSAVVFATVKGADNQPIVKSVIIYITTGIVDTLRLKASNYDPAAYSAKVKVEEDDDGFATAYIDSTSVVDAITFRLKATAYDEDGEDMTTALTWSTSDSKVAALSQTSTKAENPVNTVTIPKNTSGEAAITVTAVKNKTTKVTQTFLVSVRDYKPRLAASTITINPNKTTGETIEIVGAYSKSINSVLLYDEKKNIKSVDFSLEKKSEENNILTYSVKAREGLKNGTYKVRVWINGLDRDLTLKIVVKATLPAPKVAFQKNQQKINLFYANDGTEVKMIVSNLGTETLTGCSLQALTEEDSETYQDDKLFLDNFEAKLDSENENTIIITQKSADLKYTEKTKKPAVTGYLVLQLADYDAEKIAKKVKFKITIPTTTTTPSYVLDHTSDTFNTLCAPQTVTLSLQNKKTKEKLDLAEGGAYTAEIASTSTSGVASSCKINDAGNLELKIGDTAVRAGDVYIRIRNSSWAADKTLTYKYTVKTTSAVPKITVNPTKVTVNKNAADVSASFTFTSNQKDTTFSITKAFAYDAKAKNADQCAKITVSATEAGGTVMIPAEINKGSYKFTCEVKDQYNNVSTVPLTVQVADSKPSASLKGSMSLNQNARAKETAELTLTSKDVPAGYTLDTAKTLASIACTTKDKSYVAQQITWDMVYDTDTYKLTAALQATSAAAGSYKFSITPFYTNEGGTKSVAASKALSFSIKVYSADISVKLSAKGKLNLLDRLTGADKEYTTSNSIVYTPSLKNVKDTIGTVKIFDVGTSQITPTTDPESTRFTAEYKDGKIYVTPIKGAELDNNKTYQVKMWITLSSVGDGIWANGGNSISIKTAQAIPKVTADVSTVNMYLSNKYYTTTFTVSPKTGSVGKVESITFDEMDEKALSSFANTDGVITSVQQADGSLKVTLKLKNAVAYSSDSTNKIKMYVHFEGEGTNTAGTAITMNVKINK
jgi:hypothetical protein